jgi:Flp pilus assembly protein TadD
LVHLGAGDLAGYRRTCAEMLQHFGPTEDSEVARWVAWTIILAPDAVQPGEQPVRLAELALQGGPNSDHAITLGAALYRAGRFAEAINRLERAAVPPGKDATKPATYSPAYAWFFLAMAHQRLGHAEEGRRWLGKAIKHVEQETQDPSNQAGQTWNRRLTLQLLRREAEALLNGAAADPAQGKVQSE